MDYRNQNSPILDSDKNMTMRDRWIRGIYILLFFFIGYLLKILIMIVSVFQFLHDVIFESPNKKLLNFSDSLSIYAYDIVRFVSYNSDQKPFPFDTWPNKK